MEQGGEFQETVPKREAISYVYHGEIRETQIFIKQEPADDDVISDNDDYNPPTEPADIHLNQVFIKREDSIGSDGSNECETPIQEEKIVIEPTLYNESSKRQRVDEKISIEPPIYNTATIELQPKIDIKKELLDEDVTDEINCDVHIKEESYEVISGEEDSDEKSLQELNINNSQSDVPPLPTNTDNRQDEESDESSLGITEAQSESNNRKPAKQGNMGDFRCAFCGKHFKYKCSFKKHQSLHSGIKPYECEHCNKKFSQKVHLKHHIGMHTGVKPYECLQCHKRFTAEANLKMHLLIHNNEKPFQCDVCERKFTQKGNLEQHKLIHSGIKPFQCPDCNKCFTQKSALNQHKKLHKGYKPWECTNCKKRFSQKNDLKNHELIHSGLKPFECSVCGRQFRTVNNLNSHKRSHSEDEHFQCIECGKKFIYNQSLCRHLATHAVE